MLPRASAAVQHPPDPQGQLPRTEGLDDVVVGSVLQPDDPIGFLSQRGQHDHRNGGTATQLPAEVQPVHAGQHQIQHQQVRVLRPGQVQPGDPVGGFQYLVPVPGEVAAQHLTHGLVVINDQHAGLPAHLAAPNRGNSRCRLTRRGAQLVRRILRR